MLLSKMRSGIFSYIFLAFLLLGGAGLVMMDWTGSYKSGGGSTNVAVVGGQAIGSVEFDRLARRITRTQKLDPQIAYQAGLIDQILEMQIMDILMSKAARDYGVVVEDKHIAKQISTMLDPMVAQAGGGSKKEILERVLQSQGMTEADLVNNLRGDLERGILRNTIIQNFYVPNVMANDLYAYQHETRTIEGLLIQFSDFKINEPDDVDLLAYFDKVKDQYSEPETRSFKVAVLSPNDFGKKVEVSDADVKAYYDQNQDNFKADERRLLQQAVVDTQAKAENILKLAKDKKQSLQEAVKTVTGDTKAFSGDSGFERAGLPPQLSEPVFSAAENSYVGPIKTALGYHVIFVKTKQAAQIQPFNTVQASIKNELIHNKKADQIFTATTDIEDRLASGEPLEDLAKEMGLTVTTVKDIRMTAQDIPALKSFGEDENNILRTAFSVAQGEASPLTELKDGRMFTVRVDEVTPKRHKELKTVREDVIASWKEAEQRKQVGAAATKALDQLDAKTTTLTALAKERGAKLQTFSDLSRNLKAPPAGLTEGNLQQAMNAPKGKAIAMPTTKGILIAQVAAIKSTEKNPDAKELTETKGQLGQDVSQENLLSFVDALQQKYKVTRNKKLLEQMYAQNPDQAQ